MKDNEEDEKDDDASSGRAGWMGRCVVRSSQFSTTKNFHSKTWTNGQTRVSSKPSTMLLAYCSFFSVSQAFLLAASTTRQSRSKRWPSPQASACVPSFSCHKTSFAKDKKTNRRKESMKNCHSMIYRPPTITAFKKFIYPCRFDSLTFHSSFF